MSPKRARFTPEKDSVTSPLGEVVSRHTVQYLKVKLSDGRIVTVAAEPLSQETAAHTFVLINVPEKEGEPAYTNARCTLLCAGGKICGYELKVTSPARPTPNLSGFFAHLTRDHPSSSDSNTHVQLRG